MTKTTQTAAAPASLVNRLRRDEGGSSAVEFAIVAGPFILLILCILQVGMYYMTQSALDTAVIRTADDLRDDFTAAGTPTMPNAATLKSTIVANAGGMIYNNASLSVEIQPLSTLKTGASTYAAPAGTAAYGGVNDALALRARSEVTKFVPFPTAFLYAQSSAIVRRQGR